MAKTQYVCESCGVRVAAKEVEEGGAFFDGEHCYCAICVARLMQKVRTAQRGGKVKTIGIVFQKGLSASRSGVPYWLIYTIVAQAALAAILLVVLMLPTTVELPREDSEVKEEVRIKALIEKIDSVLASNDKLEEAFSILKRAENLAVGTPWTHLVKSRIERTNKLLNEEATNQFIKTEKRFKAFIIRNEYDLALAALDQFPERHRGTSYWQVDIEKLRKDALFYKEALREQRELIARLQPLVNVRKYDDAMELLRSFPPKYAGTPAEEIISKKTIEVAKQRQRYLDMKNLEEEQRAAMKAQLEERKRKQEEQTRKAMEEQQRLREAEEARRLAAEEARKKEEEARREQPEPGPDPDPEPEQITAVKVKGEWEEVKLAPKYEKKFPFYTPRPDYNAVERGAKLETLILPYPHKGKVSGFTVKDYGKSITVDTDADGKFDKQLPAEGGVIVLKVSYVKDTELPCAVEIKRIGGGLKYGRYGWMEGRFEGTRIAVIDENSDTKFSKVGEDAIVLGKGNGAAVLANIIEVKGKFYEIKVEDDGSKLHARPVELAAGKLLMTKGFNGRGKLDYVEIFGQVKGSKHLVSFSMAGYRKPVPVPAGKYFIHSGSISTRDKSVVRIWGGPKGKDFEVEADKALAPKWGAPGIIEFKYTLHKNGNIEIEETDIKVYGLLGERYIDWGPKQFLPRVQIKTEAGKVIVDEKFTHSSDFENYYNFEKLVPINKKLKVRILGEPGFLGPCESKWQ